jgi:hypothetical protein
LSFNTEMIRLLSEMLRLLRAQERKNDEPAREPEPFVPEKPARNETWLEAHQRRTRDDVRSGKAISMNVMIRSIPRRKPPRSPYSQSRRSNGRWSWWE